MCIKRGKILKKLDFLQKFSIIQIKIVGTNFASLLNQLTREGVKLRNTKRTDDTTLFISITANNADTTFAILQKRCYNYSVTRKIGFNALNIGVFAGILLVLVAFGVLSCFCFGVKINSENDYIVSKVQQILNKEAVVGKTWGAIDNDKLEQTLRESIEDIGLVSVSRRGAFLWVNFSDITPPSEVENEINTSGVFATQNGVVSRIFVHSGTALVKEGDTVSLGQMLIAPYTEDEEGNQTTAVARGNVYLFVWDSATVEFRENDMLATRTGRTQQFAKITFRGNVLSDNSGEIEFKNYEIERKIEYLSNVMPLKIEYITVYETEFVPVHREFKDEEQALIYEAREKVLAEVNEAEILDERHTVSLSGDTYYITYYVKREIKS